MIPVRGIVMFPHTTFCCWIGRQPSILALEKAIAEDRIVFLATQHDETKEHPAPDQVYRVGVMARINRFSYSSVDKIKVEFKCIERRRIINVEERNGYWQVTLRCPDKNVLPGPRTDKLFRKLISLIEEIQSRDSYLERETIEALKQESVWRMAYAVAHNLRLDTESKQVLLEMSSLHRLLRRLVEIVDAKVDEEYRQILRVLVQSYSL